MTWDNGPWAVEGSQTSADVGRLLAWHAVKGLTGIGSPTDLRVLALDVPGGEVRVMPGTCSLPVRAIGKNYQVYVGSNPTEDRIGIPATGSSSGRSDLIVARVENPISGEPWSPPQDPLTGQYIFTRRYPNVPAGTTHVDQVDPAASAITLARIDLPANTGTVTQGMIADLRKPSAAPFPELATFSDTQVYTATSTLNPPATGSGYRQSDWVDWPGPAAWNVPVPSWATIVQLYFSVNPSISANTWGELRFGFNGRVSVPTSFDVNVPLTTINGSPNPYSNAGGMRAHYVVGASLAVPAAERGATVPVKVQGRTFDDAVYVARGASAVNRGAVGYLAITFKQGAASA